MKPRRDYQGKLIRRRRWHFWHSCRRSWCTIGPGFHWSYGYRDNDGAVLKVDALPRNINGIIIGMRIGRHGLGALWIYFRRRPYR